MNFKMCGGLFSFCFSFTEFQLETVSKAFHITLKGFAMAGLKITKFQNSTKDEYRTKC
jgi:hypothetical protein